MFKPPLLLRHTHAQTLVGGSGLRGVFVKRRAAAVCSAAEQVVLDCGDGVRLLGFYSPSHRGASEKLVVLIHGWLGCDSSSYLLSAAASLYASGYSVFRLNLRDHGDSHHLNPELFNSARLPEAINAVAEIQRRFPHQQHFLAGFSLGGNFALRIAARHDPNNTALNQVVAVCPVINPAHAMQTINEGLWVYHQYFVQRWKRSLRKKLRHFPELGYRQEMEAARSLDDLNAFFVPKHTAYETVPEYLRAYSVAGDVLADLDVRTHIIHSADDPVVSADALDEAARPEQLSVEVTEYGGHCGFLKNYRFETWVDDRLLELF